MKFFYWFTRTYLKALFFSFYQHRTYGADHLPTGSCIIAPNHASFYDPPVVAISCKEEVYFLARKSLFERFLFGTAIRHLNALPVTGSSQDLSAFKLIFRLLKEGKKVVVFPEGARTLDGNLSEIKPGIGMIAMKSQCPIVPTYIHGTYNIWPRGQKFPKIWGRSACVFGSPIHPKNFGNLEKKEVHEAIARQLSDSILALQTWYLNGAQGTPP